MSQRVKVTGTRSIALWILILIAAVLVIGLVVGVLIVYPDYQNRQQVEQYYQAGVAFQESGDWNKAVQAFENVIAIDATYRDARSRLAEVKAKQQETDATAQAKAAQATMTAQARAEATEAAATTEAGIAQATSVAATATAQTRPTAEAQQANATATAETVARLEATYQKCLGAINLERWTDAKDACDLVFSIDPNYEEVQAKLNKIEEQIAQSQRLTPTRTLASPELTPSPASLRPTLNGDPSDWLPDSNQIPQEMYLADSYTVSNKDVAEFYDDPVAHFQRLEGWGRITGYVEKYLHDDGCNSPTGFREVFVEAVLYGTVDGAQQGFEWSIASSEAQYDTIDLGESAYQRWDDTNSDCDPPDTLRYVEIFFQRYNVLGLVRVYAVKGTVNENDLLSQAIALARSIDLNLVVTATE